MPPKLTVLTKRAIPFRPHTALWFGPAAAPLAATAAAVANASAADLRLARRFTAEFGPFETYANGPGWTRGPLGGKALAAAVHRLRCRAGPGPPPALVAGLSHLPCLPVAVLLRQLL